MPVKGTKIVGDHKHGYEDITGVAIVLKPEWGTLL